jgi:hypothetical protein
VKDLGTRIVRARMVEGMESAGRTRFNARDAHDQGATMQSWIVDQFICCGEGDQRQQVVEMALGRNPDFPVRHVIEMEISRDDTEVDSFALR